MQKCVSNGRCYFGDIYFKDLIPVPEEVQQDVDKTLQHILDRYDDLNERYRYISWIYMKGIDIYLATRCHHVHVNTWKYNI